jgi:DUF917 family protein
MARLAVEEHGPVPLVAPAGLPPGALVMPCGMAGAPEVAAERVWSGQEGRILADAVAELRGAPVAALMPFQIGGVNGVLPVAWAAHAGLPLVDADGMGRAFPGLRQQAMHLAGVAAAPVVLADGRGNTMVVHAAGDEWAERLARGAVAGFGGACAAALFCMTAERAGEAAIAGSVSAAMALGADGGDAAAEILIEDAKVVDVERRSGRTVHGHATLRAAGEPARRLRLELQDEYLVALEDGAVRAAVPDVIAVVTADTGEPVATGRLRHGQRVTVVALPAPAVWRTEAGLALAGPRAFGYELDGDARD